ncbi:MAG: PcfB family protein [Eubacteriales bacterium]
MQDEVENKTMALVLNTGKTGGRVTAKMLLKAIQWFIRNAKEKEAKIIKNIKNPPVRHGKQSVKRLGKQNQGMTNIEITDNNIKSFERYAKKYGVDFALKKDKSCDPPKYVVFFKARDNDAIEKAFVDYSKAMSKKTKHPSVKKELHHLKTKQKTNNIAKELSKTLNKTLSKGGHSR